jgi:hypothetical protein
MPESSLERDYREFVKRTDRAFELVYGRLNEECDAMSEKLENTAGRMEVKIDEQAKSLSRMEKRLIIIVAVLAASGAFAGNIGWITKLFTL